MVGVYPLSAQGQDSSFIIDIGNRELPDIVGGEIGKIENPFLTA